jgi:SAM-dependent methyltransferase
MSEMGSFHYSGLVELEKLELNLNNYNHFIVTQFIRHATSKDKVLDFGSGIGTLSNIWKKLEGTSLITCVEPDEGQIKTLLERGLSGFTTLSEDSAFDYIFTSNVLEHIEDDSGVLKTLFKHLTPDGKLGIFVPANQLVYSHIDKKLEHFRRYSKTDLVNKVVNAGFKIDKCYYVDSIGLFAWLFAKVFRIEFSQEGSSFLKIYDKYIWPLSRIFDNLGFKYLFGKNLLLLASKD